MMYKSDLIICGGGATLLEAIFIGNPIIAVPQNDTEKDFIEFIRSYIPLYRLSDLAELILKANRYDFRKKIYDAYSLFIDGKGSERIRQIVMGRNK